jgi:hypothetical protein
MQDAEFCIIGLHCLDSTSAAANGLVAISGGSCIVGKAYVGSALLCNV